MAMKIAEPLSPFSIGSPKPRRVCFSFAAYAKNLVDHLKSSDIPVEEGLTDVEFFAVESTFNFTFPPDLRSILREGLPVGPGFPNWRSSSRQQLEIFINLPILGLCKDVSRSNFWMDCWGERPEDVEEAVNLAKGFLTKSPVLVPIYRNCYIPSEPRLAGNPIFHVSGGDVKLWSYDVAGFFQQVEFKMRDAAVIKRPSLSSCLNAPSWAATEARRIEFWTELVERDEKPTAARGKKRDRWWWWWTGELGSCFEEVWWRLKDGGWREEEVREMMMMMDGGDDPKAKHSNGVERDNGSVVWHVRVLSLRLLSAGWSTEDVADSLGLPEDYQLFNLKVT